MRNLEISLVLVLAIVSTGRCYIYRPLEVTTEANSEILIQKWKTMETNMKKSVQNLVKRLMPALSDPNSTVVISDSCQDALFETILAVGQLKLWALQMLDATAKPEGGMLTGTQASLGNYEECLAISSPQPDDKSANFVGQYCLVEFRPPLPTRPKKPIYFEEPLEAFEGYTPKTEALKHFIKTAGIFYENAVRLGICIPSACSATDLKSIISDVAGKGLWYGDVLSCEVKEGTKIDTVQMVIIGCMSSILLLVLLSSLIEYFGTGYKPALFAAFCIQSNLKDLLADAPETKLGFLNGLRFISMTWVVLYHTYFLSDIGFFRNVLSFADELRSVQIQPVINGFQSVDTFFFLTSLLISYLLVKQVDKNGTRMFNPFQMLAKRIFRFYPILFLFMGIAIVMPLLSSGPMWSYLVDPLGANCRDNWWTNLLFFSNFVDARKQCISHTWYLAADIQLFLLCLLYFWLLFKKPILGHVYIGFLITASTVITGGVIFWFNDPPAIILMADEEFIVNLPSRGFMLTTCHFGIYAIGLALGTYLARNQPLKISKPKEILGWLIAVACGLTTVYAMYPWNAGYKPSLIWSILYGSNIRTLWGIALCWVCLMCWSGRGGLINSFLSWNGFAVLNRTAFMIYMIHIPIIRYLINSCTGVKDLNNRVIVVHFLAYLCLSFMAAVILRLVFEGPFMQIEKIVFSNAIKPDRKLEILKIESSAEKIDLQKICINPEENGNNHIKA